MSSCCASCPLYARTAHCHAARSHDTCHAAGPDLTPAATRRAAPPRRWAVWPCPARPRTETGSLPSTVSYIFAADSLLSAVQRHDKREGKQTGPGARTCTEPPRTDPTIHPSMHTQAHTRAHTYAHAPRARCMFTTVSMRMTATPANDDYWRVLSREGLQQLIITVYTHND